MNDGQESGTGAPALTVDTAAAAIEGMFSDTEEKQPAEATPPPAAPKARAVSEPAAEDAAEATDEAEEAPAEPEAESEVDSEDSEDADEQSTGEAAEEGAEAPRTYTVKVDGEDIAVDEAELIRGYSRTADYTRKTQAHAAAVKAFEAEQAEVRGERQHYAAALSQLSEALAQTRPAEPDWDTLRRENPAEYAATWASWQQYQQEAAALSAERQRALEKVSADEQRELLSRVEAEHGLLVEAIPAWKDETVATKEKTELAEYARDLGYSDDDLSAVYDHRLMLMLRKAMLYDRGQKQRAATQPIVAKRIAAAKVPAPGAASSAKRHVTTTTRAIQRLAKTGRVEDAAGAFLTMLED